MTLAKGNIAVPKVSVIIPVYKAESFIEKCVRNIFNQTLASMEVIFVDDCTPDSSFGIVENLLEEFPERQPQTHIVRHEKNLGSAAARRSGMEAATGEYVIQCDADDWADPELYEAMYAKAVETDADVVICDEVHEYADRSELHEVESFPSDGRRLVKEWYGNTIGMFCHNKLVRRSLYTEHGVLPWEGLNMWEDNGLMTRILCFAPKVERIKGVHYHYNRANQGAMTAGYGEKQVRQMIGVARNLTDFFAAQPDAEEFAKTALAFQFLARINLVTDSYRRLREYRRLFPGSEKIISELDPKAFSWRGLLRFRLVKWHMAWLFVTLFKIKNLISSKS